VSKELANIPFKGISMTPLLTEGDELIAIEKNGVLEIGDILLFKDPDNGEFIVHRLISNQPFVTKGDWSCSLEEVPKENIFAVVIGFKRKLNKYYFTKSFLLSWYIVLSRSLAVSGKFTRLTSRVLMYFFSSFLIKKKNDL